MGDTDEHRLHRERIFDRIYGIDEIMRVAGRRSGKDRGQESEIRGRMSEENRGRISGVSVQKSEGGGQESGGQWSEVGKGWRSKVWSRRAEIAVVYCHFPVACSGPS